jgi:hypothetical protein
MDTSLDIYAFVRIPTQRVLSGEGGWQEDVKLPGAHTPLPRGMAPEVDAPGPT